MSQTTARNPSGQQAAPKPATAEREPGAAQRAAAQKAAAAQAQAARPSASSLDARLHDVEVPVTIVVGRKTVSLKDLSTWQGDTLVTLDQAADAPLEVYVNGTRVATAELCEGEGGDGSLAIRILDVGGTKR